MNYDTIGTQTLTVSSVGTWNNAPTSYTYQWQRGAVNISGATSSSYNLQQADIGSNIRVLVAAANAYGSSTTVASGNIGPITSKPINSAAPVISGGAQVGQLVNCTQGSWIAGVTSYAYQWYYDNNTDQSGATLIAGATSSSLTVPAAAQSNYIFCRVTAINAVGATNSPTNSNNIGPIAASGSGDTTPTAFALTDVTGAAISTVQTSNQITVAGIDTPSPITVTNGEYQIGAGSWTSSPGTVSNGDLVRVRHTSSAAFSTAVNTVLTIGGISDTYTSTTLAAAGDTTPVAFTFTDVTGVGKSVVQTSNHITVTGIDSAAPITITGGEYEKNNSGSWVTSAGTVLDGDIVRVRHTSSASNSTAVNTVLTIGGVSDTFTSTTTASGGTDTIPTAFSFTDVTNVTLFTTMRSNIITVAGIDAPSPISITGGEYKVNGVGAWRTASGTVVNGDTVQVTHMSSQLNNDTVSTTLTIGGVSDTFSSTTMAVGGDVRPAQFTFVDVTNVTTNTVITSNQITVTDINTPSPITITGGEYQIGSGGWTSAAGTVINGDTVRVRHTSANFGGTSTNTELTIGEVSDTFTSQTAVSGSLNALSLSETDVDHLATAGTVIAAIQNITGGSVLSMAPAGDAGGRVAVSGTNLVTTSTAFDVTVQDSWLITIREAKDGTTRDTSFTITVNDVGGDTTPTAFVFTDASTVALNSTQTSNQITVAGINRTVPITVTNGTYEKNNSGTYTSSAGTVVNGDLIRVRHTAAATNATAVSTTLTIGGISDTFTSTTLSGAGDTSPNAFTFTDVTNALVSTVQTSNQITVSGIDSPATITITGGEYEKNSSGSWTSSSGTVLNGDIVRVRHTSSASNSTAINTVLTIGGLSDTFTSTTAASAGTGPAISSLTPTALSSTTAKLVFDSNDDTGFVYWMVTTSATPPSVAQLKATGWKHAGNYQDKDNFYDLGVTGLTPSTTYYGHVYHENAALAGSIVLTSSSFATPANDTSSTALWYHTTIGHPYSADWWRASDVSQLVSCLYQRTENHSQGRDTGSPVTASSYIFKAVYTDLAAGFEIAVEASIGTQAFALTYAETVAEMIGKMPTILRANLRAPGVGTSAVLIPNGPAGNNWVAQGDSLFHYITMGKVNIDARVSEGRLGPVIFHELAHAVLQVNYNGKGISGYGYPTGNTIPQFTAPGWESAVSSDGTKQVSQRSLGSSEDYAEACSTAFIMKWKPDRIPSADRTKISAYIPARLAHIQNTVMADLPEPWTFTDVTNATASTLYTSNQITVSGLNGSAFVTVSGGEYQIGAGSWVTTQGTVTNGSLLRVRHTSGAGSSATTTTSLTIHGVTETFVTTTSGSDSTPNAFSFTDQTNVALSTLTQSNQITVSGIDIAANITITGGFYEKNNSGSWVSTAGTVVNGDLVRVRHTSSASNSTATNTVLTIGGVSDTFTTTTVAVGADTTPTAFSFTDVTGAELSTLTTSNQITPTGYNTATAISVTDGEYQIDSGSWLTSADTISPGSAVKVRRNSSSSYSTAASVTLTIGGVSDTWSVTTKAAPAAADVTALFGGSTQGGFYDVSDLASMWQDTAGTVAAAVNSTVARINDKSGRGNNLTQATAGNRPTLRQDGAYYYLEFDGTSDYLSSGAFTIAAPWDRISALRSITWGNSDRIMTCLNGNGVLGQYNTTPDIGIFNGSGPLRNANLAVGTTGIVVERINGASSRIGIDDGSYVTGNTGTNTNSGFVLGASTGGSSHANVRYYGGIVINRALTDAEIITVKNFLASRSGI